MSNEELLEELEDRLNEIRQEEYLRGYTAANQEKEPDLLGRENVNFSITGDANISPERKEKYKNESKTIQGVVDVVYDGGYRIKGIAITAIPFIISYDTTSDVHFHLPYQ
jgi:hypothetical protein